MCADLGLEDLGTSDVLDVGCGVKFTQALLNRDAHVQRYVGIDVYREMIEFLQSTVDDPRFEYHTIDLYNERYNRAGAPLTAATELPVGDRTFDVICLFSVFTHLAPDDYHAMLHVLRRYVAPEGRLFFTLYIDEVTEGGHGLMDAFARSSGPDFVGGIETFKDLDPEHPLLWAVYTEDYAHALIDGTGWDVVALQPPDPYMQHHFICRAREHAPLTGQLPARDGGHLRWRAGPAELAICRPPDPEGSGVVVLSNEWSTLCQARPTDKPSYAAFSMSRIPGHRSGACPCELFAELGATRRRDQLRARRRDQRRVRVAVGRCHAASNHTVGSGFWCPGRELYGGSLSRKRKCAVSGSARPNRSITRKSVPIEYDAKPMPLSAPVGKVTLPFSGSSTRSIPSPNAALLHVERRAFVPARPRTALAPPEVVDRDAAPAAWHHGLTGHHGGPLGGSHRNNCEHYPGREQHCREVGRVAGTIAIGAHTANSEGKNRHAWR